MCQHHYGALKWKQFCYFAFHGFYSNWVKTTNCQVKNLAIKLYGAQSQHIMNHQVKQELSENCVKTVKQQKKNSPYGYHHYNLRLFGQNNIELDINLLVFPPLPAASPPLSFYLPAPFSFLIPFLSVASLSYLFYTLRYPHITAVTQWILPLCLIFKIIKNNKNTTVTL